MSASTLRNNESERVPRKNPGPIQWVLDGRPARSSLFHALSFAFGVALFVVLVTLISVGLSLVIIVVGIPILAIAVAVWVGAAKLERWRIKTFFGVTIPSNYQPIPKGSLWTKSKSVLGDSAIWYDVAYAFLLFPVGIIAWIVVTVCLFVPLMFLTAPLTYAWAPVTLFDSRENGIGWNPDIDPSTAGGWVIDTLPEALIACVAGVPLLLLGLAIIVASAQLHVRAAGYFLGRSRTEELEQRVDVLTKSRSDVMDAMSDERRKLERDLHDGAQQRLVSLAMNLGMAKEKMQTDPAAAKELIETSHEEAKLVLKELRELVRGIHPAVLTDRGLDAAISAIAGRSPVPVTVDVHVQDRLPDAIESTAYFVVSEALTNIAKHSNATRARVTIWLEESVLNVLVWDDGHGGALISTGSGLRGLADRVSALDGRFSVESPKGSGTTVRAEIPCAL